MVAKRLTEVEDIQDGRHGTDSGNQDSTQIGETSREVDPFGTQFGSLWVGPIGDEIHMGGDLEHPLGNVVPQWTAGDGNIFYLEREREEWDVENENV